MRRRGAIGRAASRLWRAAWRMRSLLWCPRRKPRPLTGVDAAAPIPGMTREYVIDDMAAVRADWDRIGEEWSDG